MQNLLLNRLLLIIALITFSVPICGCPDEFIEKRYAIVIKNNSKYSIAYYASLPYHENGFIFPDTSLPMIDKYVRKNIESGKETTLTSGKEWQYVFEDLPQDTMSFFVFHNDTLNKYSWEEVRANYKILKRYDLSLDDLKRSNYTITYP